MNKNKNQVLGLFFRLIILTFMLIFMSLIMSHLDQVFHYEDLSEDVYTFWISIYYSSFVFFGIYLSLITSYNGSDLKPKGCLILAVTFSILTLTGILFFLPGTIHGGSLYGYITQMTTLHSIPTSACRIFLGAIIYKTIEFWIRYGKLKRSEKEAPIKVNLSSNSSIKKNLEEVSILLAVLILAATMIILMAVKMVSYASDTTVFWLPNYIYLFLIFSLCLAFVAGYKVSDLKPNGCLILAAAFSILSLAGIIFLFPEIQDYTISLGQLTMGTLLSYVPKEPCYIFLGLIIYKAIEFWIQYVELKKQLRDSH